MHLLSTLLEISPSFKLYIGQTKGLTKQVFNFLFEMPTLENKSANVPKCKWKSTWKKGLNLLITLCKDCPENYVTLLKDLYTHYQDMKKIGLGGKSNNEEFENKIGLWS